MRGGARAPCTVCFACRVEVSCPPLRQGEVQDVLHRLFVLCWLISQVGHVAGVFPNLQSNSHL